MHVAFVFLRSRKDVPNATDNVGTFDFTALASSSSQTVKYAKIELFDSGQISSTHSVSVRKAGVVIGVKVCLWPTLLFREASFCKYCVGLLLGRVIELELWNSSWFLCVCLSATVHLFFTNFGAFAWFPMSVNVLVIACVGRYWYIDRLSDPELVSCPAPKTKIYIFISSLIRYASLSFTPSLLP